MLEHNLLRKKLIEIGYDGSKPSDSAVTQVLLAIALTLDESGLSDEDKAVVVELLRESAQEEIGATPDMSEDRWEDFNYGNVKFGDFVRVKRNAYSSETGAKHNGLVGILVAGAYGRYSVNYIGTSSGSTMRHPMGMLESLKMR